MRPRTPAEEEVIRSLNRLIALEHDEAAAAEAGASRLHDASVRDELQKLAGVHRRHAVELSLLMYTLGGGAMAHGALDELVTTARVLLAGLVGDRAILEAVKHTEDSVGHAYSDALATLLPARVHAVLEQHLRASSEHSALVEKALRALPVRAA